MSDGWLKTGTEQEPYASLSWKVIGTIVADYHDENEQLSNILWTYEYSFVGFKPRAVSHFIIEVSDDIESINSAETPFLFSGVEPGGAVALLDDYTLLGSSIHGVKFEGILESEGGTFTVQFVSSRIPVWGDFYAKGGGENGGTLETAYNAGFTNADPTDPAADGSLEAHILRPDTSSGYVAEVPEPGTLIGLLSMSIVGAFACRLRRRKQ